jgi:hypothetical protein
LETGLFVLVPDWSVPVRGPNQKLTTQPPWLGVTSAL